MFDILVCGQISLDLLPDMAHISAAQLIQQGKLLEVEKLQVSTGGVVSNTGLALQRLGVDVGLNCLVGNDLFGQFTIDYIKKRAEHLADFIAVHPTEASSVTFIIAPQNQDRTFLHLAGTNNIFGYEWVNFDAVRQSKIFHFGYPPLLPRMYADNGAELTQIFAKVRELGVITSLDTTVPEVEGRSGQADWVLILAKTLPYVDIFIPSIEEIIFMLRRADYDRWQGQVMQHITIDYLSELAAEILEYGVAVVGFKLGEQGMYARTSKNRNAFVRLEKLLPEIKNWLDVQIYFPAYVVDVAGTTGAGDAAYAGFLAALVRGLEPISWVQMACAVGACNCEVMDTTTGIQSWEATRQRMANGWQTRASSLFES